jgi:REP element-mobilizing transposase RayT
MNTIDSLGEESNASPLEFRVYFITWTTYGTWLPGDARGWRKRRRGPQLPQPLLEQWCRKEMNGEAVLLQTHDRDTVEDACREHCQIRGWHLLAVSARTNHIHVVVGANTPPKTVRDQLKANCTRRLRTQSTPLNVEKTWTTGGDCEILDRDEDIDAAIRYVVEAQDNKKAEYSDESRIRETPPLD